MIVAEHAGVTASLQLSLFSIASRSFVFRAICVRLRTPRTQSGRRNKETRGRVVREWRQEHAQRIEGGRREVLDQVCSAALPARSRPRLELRRVGFKRHRSAARLLHIELWYLGHAAPLLRISRPVAHQLAGGHAAYLHQVCRQPQNVRLRIPMHRRDGLLFSGHLQPEQASVRQQSGSISQPQL